LYNLKVHAIIGFLYARFHKGSEFWEMHEVLRKCAVMGLLIFLPETSRAAVGILICVLCCCTLNYFQPHRNKVVLFVSQMSFLVSTFKYVGAVFLRINTLEEADEEVMGWIMVMFDVVFMLASFVGLVLMVVLLRASATKLQEKEVLAAVDFSSMEILFKGVDQQGGKPVSKGGGGGEHAGERPASSVKVVPTQEALGGVISVGSKRTNERGVQRRPSSTITLVNKALLHDKVVKTEESSSKARDKAVAAIKEREIKADLRVRQRLEERKKNGKIGKNGKNGK
jgi:general stress protein CsbA